MRNAKYLALVVTLAAAVQAGTEPIHEIRGVVDEYPPEQIDATVVVNYGEFVAQSLLMPYEFQNTRYVTNYGEMLGIPGFQFDYLDGATGFREPLERFVNARGATVAADYYGLGSLLTGVNLSSYVWVSAKDVQNHGLLSVSAEGQMKLEGANVDVARSQLDMVLPGGGFGSVDQVSSNTYRSASGIADYWWGGPDLQDLNLRQFYRLDTNVGPIVTTPVYGVTNAFATGFDAFSLINPVWGAYTNRASATNLFTQAGFVGFNTNLLSGRVSFSGAGNGFRRIGAQLSMTLSNLVTGAEAAQQLYVYDSLGSDTNRSLLQNGPYMRPSNYRVTRVPLFGGGAGNATLTTNYFYNTAFSNLTASSLYTAYSADVIASGGGSSFYPVEGASISNVTGRLEIKAGNLNLEKVRARANGLMAIQADHLVSSEDARLQAGNYIIDLASTNGTLHLTKLLSVEATKVFEGPLYLWSALWTNFTGTNVIGDDGSTNAVTINHNFHALLVDTRFLGYTQLSTTHDLTLRSTNIVVDDDFNLAGRCLLDGENVTLNGRVAVLGTRFGFGATNAPRLKNFTNNGAFSVPNELILGPDRAKPLTSVVNNGQIGAQVATIHSAYFQNSGGFSAGSFFRLDAGVAKFEGGSLNASVQLDLAAGDIKFHRHTSSTLGHVFLTATNSLSDSGWEAANRITCGDGFSVRVKPAYGDLLGTRLESSASIFGVVDHVWAAVDRGTGVNGFTNNLAIGSLGLSSGRDAVLRFHAPSAAGAYAVYVDYLDLQGFVLNGYNAGRLADYLELDPNVTLYFAYANVPVEDLDGQLDGQVRWCRDFAGPNSSVLVALPSGKTGRFNRGLRESIRIDSDGDGIANGYDLTPFPDIAASLATGTQISMDVDVPVSAVVRWTAEAQATYTVEFSTDLGAGDWQTLETVTNPDKAPREMAVEDGLSTGGSRYYRVRRNP